MSLAMPRGVSPTAHARGQPGAGSPRLTGLDALRGLASLAVCWLHLTNTYGADSFARASGSYGWLGVEAFFVISGFVIPYSMYRGGYVLRDNWAAFIGKRILRIDPPYLVAALLALLLSYASAATPGFRGQVPSVSAPQLLFHLGYLNGIAGYPWLIDVFWTLAIEFQYYLLISLAFGMIRSSAWQRRWPFAALCILSPFLSHANIYVFQFLGLFMLGITMFQYRVGVIGRGEAAALLGLASASVAFSMGSAELAVGLVSAIVILSGWDFGRTRALAFLGSISYSLYLIHVPVGGRVVNLGRRYVESAAGEWLLSLLSLVVCLVFAALFWRFVERPAQQWASRITYRSGHASAPVGLPRPESP